MKREWYRINAKADSQVAELEIYGDIGESFWDDNAVSAKQFLDDLKALPPSASTIRVKVNSFGGSVFDAVAIANALREQGLKGRTIETTVEGIAASAASVVIMAGSKITMGDNALVMIHNPWTLGIGNAAEMRSLADTLDKIRDQIVATYKWHSQLSDEEIVDLMDAETWMDADESIANGFATEKVEGLKAAACLDSKQLAKLKVPEKFQARVDAVVAKPKLVDGELVTNAADVLRMCREAECLELAETLIAANATTADVEARITEAKTQKAAAAVRSAEITALCATAKLPELASGYIAGGMTPADVRAHLTTVTAKLDRVQIDSSLDPNAGQKPKARIDVAAIYAARNSART